MITIMKLKSDTDNNNDNNDNNNTIYWTRQCTYRT